MNSQEVNSSEGQKNHLSWSPGQVEFQAGQANIFTQCPVVKFIWQYIQDKLFGNRTSKNLTLLARGTSENFKIFFTPGSTLKSVV